MNRPDPVFIRTKTAFTYSHTLYHQYSPAHHNTLVDSPYAIVQAGVCKVEKASPVNLVRICQEHPLTRPLDLTTTLRDLTTIRTHILCIAIARLLATESMS